MMHHFKGFLFDIINIIALTDIFMQKTSDLSMVRVFFKLEEKQ